MKLKINKACDLNSISVLPPRRSGGMSSGADGIARSQASQFRSQSQQSFSQGFSQLSQSSFDENLANDLKLGSQEKVNCSKRISSVAPIASTLEESQLQLVKASNNNGMPRWNAASYSNSRCQPSEDFEHKFRLLESSTSRVSMILDSLQSDVMQIHRAVKEVTLESEGIRQKINLLENSVQQMVKSEHDLKSYVEESKTSICNEIAKNSNCDVLIEILSAIKALPEQIGANIAKVEHEVQRVFAKQEVMMTAIKHSNAKQFPNTPSYMNKACTDHQQPPEDPKQERKVKFVSVIGNNRRSLIPKIEELNPKVTGQKTTDSKYTVLQKQPKEVPPRKQEPILRIIIDSDEDSDGSPLCLVNKETVNENRMLKEVQEDTMRILEKARKRRRRQRNPVFVV